jgi:hypothetical protein
VWIEHGYGEGYGRMRRVGVVSEGWGFSKCAAQTPRSHALGTSGQDCGASSAMYASISSSSDGRWLQGGCRHR